MNRSTRQTSRKAAAGLVLSSVALLCVLSTPAAAGVNRWTESCGAESCVSVTGIALDPFDESVMYGITRDSFWLSTDGGATWKNRSLLTQNEIFDSLITLRVSWADPRTLYVLTDEALHRSTDGGSHWTRIKVPTGYFGGDLILDVRNPNTLYVGRAYTSCDLFSCKGGGVFRSDDRGSRWHSIGLENKHVTSLAADPIDLSNLYAIADGVLFQTTNGGRSWNDVTPDGARVWMAVVDPVIPSTIYVTTARLSGLSAGIFKSTDRARTWRLIRDEDVSSAVIAIDPVHSMELLATSRDGIVIRSANGGETWSEMNDGLEESGQPFQLIIAPDGTSFHAVVGSFDGVKLFQYSLVPPRRRAVRR